MKIAPGAPDRIMYKLLPGASHAPSGPTRTRLPRTAPSVGVLSHTKSLIEMNLAHSSHWISALRCSLRALPAVLGFALISAVAAPAAFSQTLVTDKDDYAPGETTYFSASGFQP